MEVLIQTLDKDRDSFSIFHLRIEDLVEWVPNRFMGYTYVQGQFMEIVPIHLSLGSECGASRNTGVEWVPNQFMGV